MGSPSWEVSFWRECAFDLVVSFLTWWFLLSFCCNGWLFLHILHEKLPESYTFNNLVIW